MEQRKIIIVDSSSNRKVTVNTDATSFGELKRAARAAGINYEGKDWLEGLTKTSPVSDDSLLPVNVNYKGTVTNNLVYMLTNTNKRIRSGMNRQEAYAEIKKLGLAEDVKKKFGRNFTQVGTNDLIAFINKNNKKANAAPAKETQKKEVENLRNEMEKATSAPAKDDSKSNSKYASVIAAIARFLAFLPKEVIDDAAEVAKNLTPETVVEEVDFSKMSIDELKRQFGR